MTKQEANKRVKLLTTKNVELRLYHNDFLFKRFTFLDKDRYSDCYENGVFTKKELISELTKYDLNFVDTILIEQ